MPEAKATSPSAATIFEWFHAKPLEMSVFLWSATTILRFGAAAVRSR
jgi:hypothetical protein